MDIDVNKNMLLFLVSLFHVVMNGVFGESVSVTGGDSVTLHTSLPEIQRDDVLEWRFGAEGALIAQINRGANKSFTYDDAFDGRFRGRLKLDNQTGDLTITNIRTQHSGLYEVTNSKHTQIFNVSVLLVDPVKSVSVLVGDTVTLNTDVTEILRDDVIQWRFEHQNSPIAEINREARKVSKNVGPDGRFRDRLQMDYLTGSLTIRNITTKHSGLYEVDISNSKHTIHKSFRVTVRDSDSDSGLGSGSGLSAGAVVGMCVALLVFGALAGAVIYCRRQVYEVNRQKLHVVWVTEGEYVALDPYRTEIREDNSMQWKFRGALIAERRGATGEITLHDERFKDRMQLEKDSGCLITKDTSPNMSGDYELQILRRGHQLLKTFTVFVFDETETDVVKEGDSLNIKVIGIRTDDQMQWKFVFGREDSPIAQIKGGIPEIFPSAAGGRFRDRLKLDPTGSLTIKKIRPTDAGVYHLYNTKTRKSMKSFRVNVLNPEDNGNNPDGTPLTHFYVS